MMQTRITKIVITTDAGKEVTFEGSGTYDDVHTVGGLHYTEPVHYVSATMLIPQPPPAPVEEPTSE